MSDYRAPLRWRVYARLWWLWHDFRRIFWPHAVYVQETWTTRRGDPDAKISVRVLD